MDIHSTNQYLKKLRIEYLKTKSKKGKGRLLDETRKRTDMNRKYLIRKLRTLSNLKWDEKSLGKHVFQETTLDEERKQ